MRLFTLLSFLLLGGSQNAIASLDNWALNGFVNQTALSSSDNTFLGHTDDRISLDYREAALIAKGEIAPKLQFSAQVISRKAGAEEDGNPRLDYGFLTWSLSESGTFSNSIILGRVKVPIGFHNETRDSPFTRNGILLPQSLYIDRLRNSTMAAEQLMYLGEIRVQELVFTTKLSGGQLLQSNRDLASVYSIPSDAESDFESGNARNLQLLADYGGGRYRFAYSYQYYPVDFSVSLAQIRFEGSADSRYEVYSAEYNELKWSITAEYARAKIIYPTFQQIDRSDIAEGFYLQGTYHPEDKWSAFIRYDSIVMDKRDRNGEQFQSDNTRNLDNLPGYVRYAKDTILGLSFNPNTQWLLRGEIHNIEGTTWVTPQDAPNERPQKYWNLIAFSASWRF